MSYTLDLSTNQVQIIDSYLSDYFTDNNNKYITFQAKYKDSTISLYKTNKLLIQGKNYKNVYLELCDLLGIASAVIKIETTCSPMHSTIGSDEVGTGDFFGPIIVAATYVPKDLDSEILALGVTDSKLLTDSFILELAPKLIEKLQFSYTILTNRQYNIMWKQRKMNMNQIKAYAHDFVLTNLKKKVIGEYDAIIIDAFTDQKKYFEYLKDRPNHLKDVRLIQKAEKLFTSVASASVIARYFFLKEMERLSLESGYQLLKGASDKVDKLATQIISEKGIEFLANYAKMNFKNLIKAQKNVTSLF